ncbi:pentapeptide repeat-containing protein [Acinetobacter haemolyticus]|uniref:pentapeptide repeat-containing protein n=1 Tax=Acinetobacter haemolyticus TaxID=29430 RepID=UPI003F573DC6
MKDREDINIQAEIADDFQRLILQIDPEKRVNEKREHSVRERLEKHKIWLDSNGKDGVRFQAKNEDFTGVDFSSRDLRKAEFYSCVLDYCNFYGVNLGAAATFWKCSIKKSLIIQASLENSQFVECEIENSNFRSSKFIRATVTGLLSPDSEPSLANNDFNGCTFKDSTFNNFNFFGSSIKGAILDGVYYNGCNISFLDFTDTNINSSLSVYKSKSIYIKLSGMLIEGSSFVECDLTNSEFEGSQAKGSDFSRSNLTRANFRNADLSKSRFNMTLGNDMKFYGANINNSEMRLSSFREANFYNCKLYEADLSGSDLISALINETTNRNLTNFSGCTWTNGKRCKAGSVGICSEED